MKDYSKAKIYKIVCNISGLVYVGSTCEPTLARRLAKHVGNYKIWSRDNSKTSYMTSYKILEGNDYDIVLIEEVQCETQDQLHARERFYIESMECVNIVIPHRKNQERCKKYREEHKEEIKLKKKEYHEEHKEEIKSRRGAVINCQCTKQHTLQNKARHEKSEYHQNYFKSHNEVNGDN